jgi:putative hemolysin
MCNTDKLLKQLGDITMKLVLLFLLALPNFVLAKSLSFTDENGVIKMIKILEVNMYSVNNACANNMNKCQALLATKLVRSISSLDKNKILGHPASKMCFAKGGSSVILKDVARNEYDYCTFPDGSMIDSWQLKSGVK